MSAAAQRLTVTPERRGMLAKVHLARKQLGLDEEAYRVVVARITGHPSARVASDAQLHRLVAEFTRLGFKPVRVVRPSAKANVRMIYALWAELTPYLASGSVHGLHAFVARQTRNARHPDGISAPEFLDGQQANRVIEGLKAWLVRVRPAVAS